MGLECEGLHGCQAPLKQVRDALRSSSKKPFESA